MQHVTIAKTTSPHCRAERVGCVTAATSRGERANLLLGISMLLFLLVVVVISDAPRSR